MRTNREYKATLFSELFSDPDNLRELYNALADTNYGAETPIEINTLENVFFNDLKNDVSFTIDDKYVVLLEHQSTINANMPLRCLMYIARVYEKITEERAIYHEKQIEIPTPEFIVLYNGIKQFPAEKILYLSDAYKASEEYHKQSGNLDLTVRVVNINPRYNSELLSKSETLNGYTIFIERVRHNQSKGSSLRDAVNEAISYCKTQGTLESFLTEHGAEASNMLMTEFNIDIAKEVWQEEAREDAREEFREEIAALQAEIERQQLESKKQIEKQTAENEKQAKESAKQAAEIESLQAAEIAKQAAEIESLRALLKEKSK